ncbi:MAG: TauD/TfdA family dioxygenase [Bdellovibrionia bacterium]
MNYKNILPFGALVEASKPGEDILKLNIDSVREIFDKEHLVILRGFRTFSNKEEFSEYCELFGEISLWPFGKVLELIEQPNPEDHIFDHNYVPLHWDGMYRPQVPELQIFHCVNAPLKDQGGRTTFSNTTLALKRATEQERNLWSRATGVYERKMEFYHSKTAAPVVTEHPSKKFPVLRFCEPPKAGDTSFVNHPDYDFEGIAKEESTNLIQSLQNALYSKENFYAHEWRSGDVVISDNYTLLHGREAFTSGAPRHLQRVHVLGKPALDNPHLVFHA